ncbi:hypothetical protein [Aurantimicrobium minutum]|uniref:hypothetical protein n=1 Tax=Aurantimicrobium minutum TaxID=708131 RepID=UPI002474C721|nr:hypothetical protein [Aurantimicrobium minutum]MDH6423409.1 hypothetical protein [Aurantimicrobium minutum]
MGDDKEYELEDDQLAIASGGGAVSDPEPSDATNATMIVYASTFIPFDSSF